MLFSSNPLARMVNNYLMKMAIPLAAWFIVEYLVRNAMSTNVLLSFLVIPMMVITPIAIWWILRKLRRDYLYDGILGIQAWSFGVQLIFYAGLIEALFIYVYNEFLKPGNLKVVQEALISQYENVYQTFSSSPALSQYAGRLQEMIDELKEAPVLTPIETAITALSNDVFFGIILMIPIALIVRKKPNPDLWREQE